MRVKNVLKNITTYFKLKMFLMCLNQVNLTVLTLFVSMTNLLVQSVVYTYQQVSKLLVTISI